MDDSSVGDNTVGDESGGDEAGGENVGGDRGKRVVEDLEAQKSPAQQVRRRNDDSPTAGGDASSCDLSANPRVLELFDDGSENDMSGTNAHEMPRLGHTNLDIHLEQFIGEFESEILPSTTHPATAIPPLLAGYAHLQNQPLEQVPGNDSLDTNVQGTLRLEDDPTDIRIQELLEEVGSDTLPYIDPTTMHPLLARYARHAPLHLQNQLLQLGLQPHNLDQPQESLHEAVEAMQYALMVLSPAIQSLMYTLQPGPVRSSPHRPMFHMASICIGLVLGTNLRRRRNDDLNVSLNINLRGETRGLGRPHAAASSAYTTAEALMQRLELGPTVETLQSGLQSAPRIEGQPLGPEPGLGMYHTQSLFVGILLGMAIVDLNNSDDSTGYRIDIA